MLDLTKPVRTRSGLSVRILVTDMRDSHPVVAIVTDTDGSQSVETYDLRGRYLGDTPSTLDLVNVGATPRDVLRRELAESLAGRTEPSPELQAMREAVSP